MKSKVFAFLMKNFLKSDEFAILIFVVAMIAAIVINILSEKSC